MPRLAWTFAARIGYKYQIRLMRSICVFQVSRPYLGFYPDTKHFIMSCKQNIVEYAKNRGGNVVKNAISV